MLCCCPASPHLPPAHARLQPRPCHSQPPRPPTHGRCRDDASSTLGDAAPRRGPQATREGPSALTAPLLGLQGTWAVQAVCPSGGAALVAGECRQGSIATAAPEPPGQKGRGRSPVGAAAWGRGHTPPSELLAAHVGCHSAHAPRRGFYVLRQKGLRKKGLSHPCHRIRGSHWRSGGRRPHVQLGGWAAGAGDAGRGARGVYRRPQRA